MISEQDKTLDLMLSSINFEVRDTKCILDRLFDRLRDFAKILCISNGNFI